MLLITLNNSQAAWLQSRLEMLKSNNNVPEALKDIKSIIAGMGSLSDMYLVVPPGVNEDEEQFNIRFRNLVFELDKTITMRM